MMSPKTEKTMNNLWQEVKIKEETADPEKLEPICEGNQIEININADLIEGD